MRYFSTLFVVVFLLVPSAHAGAEERLTPRPLDPIAVETFDSAIARSATVRSLVATLESSNVIVHIESSRMLPPGIGGTTRFITSRAGYRYVRIAIRAELSRSMRAAILGHELQHACEVADSGANDAAAVERLFERDGERMGRFYETRAAQDTERLVMMELQSRRTLQAEPVVKFHH